ncbi:MAG: FAD-binding oxidoreductase [Candidatus Kaiserbacteria bacterium]|nr:FAD-binding oxidoreductase [Candidatus Kaiserbacteria bacterium]
MAQKLVRKARRFSRKLVITLAILLLIIGFLIKKVIYYAAGPVGEKDCPPLNPGEAVPDMKNTAFDPALDWEQRGGTINDSSCLDRTAIYGMVSVKSEADISRALSFAKAHGLHVSIAGVRHSQGGQAFAKDALVVDMRDYKSMSVNADTKILTVQSGATWHDIQNYLHPRFAVKAMQSTDIFTVGGSISVNAHGMDHQAGSVADTIRSMRVMLPSGEITTVSPSENAELFRHIVGGYGLFGVILDAKIDVVDNVIYQSGRQTIQTNDFPAAWAQIEKKPDIGLFYAHLSTAPSSLLDEAILYTYTKTDLDPLKSPPLHEVSSIPLRRLTINLAKLGPIPATLKWWSEKYIEPKLESCEISRNDAQKSGEGCLVSRNEPMHDSVPYLKNDLVDDTDILHEYFIPRANILPFIADMKTIFQKNNANVLNVSIRVVHKENIALNYAPQDAFSVVLYLNQKTDNAGNAKMKKVTEELIDAAHKEGGKFFLPYQLYYSKAQLEAAYPNIDAFFSYKKAIDPQNLFTNTWYETYGA